MSTTLPEAPTTPAEPREPDTAEERDVAQRADWRVELPAIAARWGLSSALRELEAVKASGDVLPATAGDLRTALRSFLSGPYAPTAADDVARASRPQPFTDPVG